MMNEIGRPLTSDLLPIVFGRVLDDRPALQEGLLVILEHQTVTGFPDRCFLDIAHADRPLSLAQEIERHGFFVRVVPHGENFECLPKLRV